MRKYSEPNALTIGAWRAHTLFDMAEPEQFGFRNGWRCTRHRRSHAYVISLPHLRLVFTPVYENKKIALFGAEQSGLAFSRSLLPQTGH